MLRVVLIKRKSNKYFKVIENYSSGRFHKSDVIKFACEPENSHRMHRNGLWRTIMISPCVGSFKTKTCYSQKECEFRALLKYLLKVYLRTFGIECKIRI